MIIKRLTLDDCIFCINKNTVILRNMEKQQTKEEGGKAVELKEKRKHSATYTIKQLKNCIGKLVDLNLLNEEEAKPLKVIHKKVLDKYVKNELGD